jgi:AraC-like DNA-binding protein
MDLNYRDAPSAMRSQVTKLIRELIPTGACSIDVVAQRLSIDRRTVHRRLAVEGTTYSDTIDQIRLELLNELDNPTLTALASELGFSSLSAFSRWRRKHGSMAARAEFLRLGEAFWSDGDQYCFSIRF